MKQISTDKFNAAELFDLGSDFTEIALDAFLEDGVVKEIPIIKTVVTLFKTGKSIKDYYTIKKLVAFLNGCKKISKEKVSEFVQSLDDEKRTEIGMKLLLIVDKVDDIKKAELIGRAFVLLLNKEIDLQFYLRLCHMIEMCFYSDILSLKYFKNTDTILTSKNETVPAIVLETLFSSGLISDYGFDGGDASGNNSGTRYGLNDYGAVLNTVL